MKKWTAFLVALIFGGSILSIVPAGVGAAPGDRSRISVSSSEASGDSGSYTPTASRGSRYVAFQSDATNLVPGDTNNSTDTFVRDLRLGTTTRVSVASTGTQSNNVSYLPWISGNGRYVAFYSDATNLVPNDTNGVSDIFVHDRQMGTTERVSVDSTGAQSNGGSPNFDGPAMSGDGRYVTFPSSATNLAPGDTNGKRDYFLRDRQNGTTELVTVSSTEVQSTGDTAPGDLGASRATVSDDGRFVAFSTQSNNLMDVPYDNTNPGNIFVRDRTLGTTELISINRDGSPAGRGSLQPAISADGRYVAFSSGGLDLADPRSSFGPSVYRRDRQTQTTEVVSLTNAGTTDNGFSHEVRISPDGRRVAWTTNASVGFPTGSFVNVFERNLDTDTTDWLSAPMGGGPSTNHSIQAALSAQPGFAAWVAYGDDQAPGDTNGQIDVVAREGETETVPPTVTITTPVHGASYTQGQSVTADYLCEDDFEGSGLQSCSGPVADGAPIATATIGTHQFTVNATDAAGNTATSTHNYTVVAPPFTGFRITTASPLPDVTLHQSYSVTLAATAGTPPYKWKKIGKLPTGLQLKATSGVISGVPKRVGTYSFSVQARYKTKAPRQKPVWHVAEKAFSIKVTP